MGLELMAKRIKIFMVVNELEGRGGCLKSEDWKAR